MKYFYARVSTKEQNLDRQLLEAEKHNIDRVFSDKQSGKNFERAQYQLMKSIVKRGDEVFIKELDRLGRNKEGIKEEIRWFQMRGVTLRILDIPTSLMDFGDQTWISDMVNNILIEVLGAVAEQERKKTLKRQREGFDAMPIVDGRKFSKKTGRPCGRPKKEISDFRKIFEEQKMTHRPVEKYCAELGISRATWYNKARAV